MTCNCFSATQNVFPLTQLKVDSTKNERERKDRVRTGERERVVVEITDKKILKYDFQTEFCLSNQ